jgi:hypothetical protein
MRSFCTLLIFAGFAVAAPAPPSASDKVAGLIKQLAGSDARDREAAQRALEELGQAAIEPLKKAALTGDADFARRATALAEKIRLATDTTSPFAPTIVELNLKDIPVPEAIAALAKGSGYPIRLADSDKLKERKVTLNTGKVPFWQAVDELCKKANLSLVDGVLIRDGAAVAPGVGIRPGIIAPAVVRPAIRILPKAKAAGAPDKEDKKEEREKGDNKGKQPPDDEKPQGDKLTEEKPKEEKKDEKQPVPAPAPAIGKAGFQIAPALLKPATTPKEIVVVDQAPTLPASVAGAFYVRGVSHGQLTAVQQRSFDIALQVIGEPKLAGFTVSGVTVKKALDDQEQTRTLSIRSKTLAPLAPGATYSRSVSGISRDGLPAIATYTLAVSEAAKEAKALKEFSGTLKVQIRSTPSELALLRELGKKKSIETSHGITIQLHEFEKAADGTYNLQAEVLFPVGSIIPDTSRELPLVAAPIGAPRPALPPLNSSGLRLTDKNGNEFPLAALRVTSAQTNEGAALAAVIGSLLPPQEQWRTGVRTRYAVTASYTPIAGKDTAPSQLVFRGSKTTTLDVPFELKNLPLK